MEADKVVVELIAKVEGFDGKIKQSASSFEGGMKRIETAATKAETAVAKTSAQRIQAIKAESAQISQFARMLGTQLNDVGGLMTSDRSPFVVPVKQAPKVASAMRIVTSGAAAMGGMMGGLVVAGTLAGAAALAKWIFTAEDAEKAVADLVAKLKENADATENNRRAQELFSRTTEGVEKAIRDATAARKDAIAAENTSAEQANIAAQNNLAEEISIRNKTKRLIDQARAYIEVAEAQRLTGGDREQRLAGATVSAAARARLDALTESLAKHDKLIAEARAELNATRADLASESAKRAVDPIAKLNRQYDLEVNAAKAAARATGEVTNALTKQIEAIERRRQAALKAARDEAAAARRRPSTDVGDRTRFISPVAGGSVTGRFGEMRGNQAHAGRDLAVPVGTSVKAPAAGVIIESGTLPGYGNVVFIDHGRGTVSRLAHLSQMSVAKGDIVTQGQIVGLSGGARGASGAGNSSGPHVHQEVRVSGRAVDPSGGIFNTDIAAATGRAEQIADKAAREAQAAADKALRQTNDFNAEMAKLNGELIEAQRGRVESYAEQLEIAEQDIIIERDRQNAGYEADATEGRIRDEQAKLLILKNNQVASARLAGLNTDEVERQARVAVEVEEARQQIRIEELSFEQDNAKTAHERKNIALALLDAEIELQRIALQRIIDNSKAGSAEAQIAQIQIDRLGVLRNERADQINRDPSNRSPGEQYADSLQKSAGEMNEALEDVAVNGLKLLEDGILNAIQGTESLADAFSNMADQIIAELLRIAIQQLIIKPMANLLFGGAGGGSGLMGGLSGIFGGGMSAGTYNNAIAIGNYGGGLAGGGPVSAGRAYTVGENGRELFVPGESGRIIPNNTLARMGGAGGGGGVVQIHVVAGEVFETHTRRISGQVAIQTVRAAVPAITDMAAAKTRVMAGRPRL